jgi:hypothetical protein
MSQMQYEGAFPRPRLSARLSVQSRDLRGGRGAMGETRRFPPFVGPLSNWPGSLRVFGRLPGTGVEGCAEAGVRKASREETAGEFAPAVVSVYGDLRRMFGLISRCRTGTPAEQVS